MSEVFLTSAPDPWVKVYKDQIELDEALEYWQRVLRLQDWTIIAKIARASEMQLEDAQAEVFIYETVKSAKITLKDPIDHFPDAWFPVNHQESLIHELLHIHTKPIRRTGKDDGIAEEQCVDALSKAFDALMRSK